MTVLFNLTTDLPVIEDAGGLSIQQTYTELFNTSRETGGSALQDLGEEDYNLWKDACWYNIETRGDGLNQSTATQRRETNRKTLQSIYGLFGRLLVKDQDFYFKYDGAVQFGTWPPTEPKPASTDAFRTLPLPGLVAP